MSISRKITITNFEQIDLLKVPIRKLFNVGPTTSSNSITTLSSFKTVENSFLTKKIVSSLMSESVAMPSIVEEYEFFNSDTTQSLSDWKKFVNDNLTTNILSDNFSIIDGFYDLNDAFYTNINENAYTANVNYEYNFLIEKYEEQISSPNINEKILPNMYAIMFAKTEQDVGSQEKTFNNIITLNNTINATNTYSLQNKVMTNKSEKGEYHDLFAKAISDLKKGRKKTGLQTILGPMTNIVIPPEEISTLNEMNGYKELYPMYNEINITMDKFSSFSTLLRDSNLTLSLINYIINNQEQAKQKNFTYSEQSVVYNTNVPTDDFTRSSYLATENGQVASVTSEIQQKILKSFDILEWWSKTKEDFTPSQTNTSNTLVLGIEGENVKLAKNKQYEFARSLSYVIFYGKLRKLAKITQRNFDEVISGEPCYTETVFYKITKHKNGVNDPIQTFWIPNTTEVDNFQFIDTQVKYNQEYEYRIYAYNLIIDSKVETIATQINSDSTFGNIATLRYEMTPNFSLIETMVYKISNKIIDDPPISPEVLVIPYKDINNKIKFFFNNSTGEDKSLFFPINTNDTNTLKTMNTMYTKLPINEVKFKSDDIASAFEVYRITTKPKEYSDFQGALIATVTTDYSTQTFTKASSASFVDTLLPNTKYYYTFRTIDYHNHISNPTDIYELELVDDDGAIYLRTDILTIKDLKLNKQGEKKFKKLFYIKPEIAQTLINATVLNAAGINSTFDIYGLGKTNFFSISASSVWDKKFKLRFISKKTGKIFDLNLQMELEIDKENL